MSSMRSWLRSVRRCPQTTCPAMGGDRGRPQPSGEDPLPNPLPYPSFNLSNVTIKDCAESFFERNRSCSLPWRSQEGAGKVCISQEDLEAFKTFYNLLLKASEQDVFDVTGCYRTCTYTRGIIYPNLLCHNGEYLIFRSTPWRPLWRSAQR